MYTKSYKIGKATISVVTISFIIEEIKKCIQNKISCYICVSNMRTVTIANKDPHYLSVMENALMCIPDGMPLVWCGKAWGIKEVQRTCGPELFRTILKLNDNSFKHFFLGDTDETLSKLKEKSQKEFNCEISGMYSPPFLPIENYNIKDIANRINKSGANIVWCSIRAPKQDILAARLQPLLNPGIVIIGIGAAFRFLLGEYKQAPIWAQKTGLSGLFCLRNTSFFKELKWYIVHSSYLCYYLFSIWTNRMVTKTHL